MSERDAAVLRRKTYRRRNLRKSGLKAKIFFRIDEAATWLGVSPDRVES